MAAPLLFLIAILAPAALAIVVLVPSYAGILGACYLIYNKDTGPNPLTDKLGDVFYIIDVYHQLLTYGIAHIESVSTLKFTLPLLVLPLTGFLLAFWLTRRLIRALRNLFHLTTNI